MPFISLVYFIANNKWSISHWTVHLATNKSFDENRKVNKFTEFLFSHLKIISWYNIQYTQGSHEFVSFFFLSKCRCNHKTNLFEFANRSKVIYFLTQILAINSNYIGSSIFIAWMTGKRHCRLFFIAAIATELLN